MVGLSLCGPHSGAELFVQPLLCADLAHRGLFWGFSSCGRFGRLPIAFFLAIPIPAIVLNKIVSFSACLPLSFSAIAAFTIPV